MKLDSVRAWRTENGSLFQMTGPIYAKDSDRDELGPKVQGPLLGPFLLTLLDLVTPRKGKHPVHQHICPLKQPSQWGAVDAEIKVSSCEHTELKRSPFKAWSRSVYSHTCYDYCQEFLPCLFLPLQSIHLHFAKPSHDFFLRWLWLTPVPVKARRMK